MYSMWNLNFATDKIRILSYDIMDWSLQYSGLTYLLSPNTPSPFTPPTSPEKTKKTKKKKQRKKKKNNQTFKGNIQNFRVEISVPVVLLYGGLYFLAPFIQSIGIVFIESKLHTSSLTPWSAPLSSSFVTTSVWPFCAARWSGVASTCRRKNNDLNILCQLLIRCLLFFVTFHCPIY